MALLRARVIPIVNENDVVSVDEIRFSDNDHLASLVAILARADLLVLLTAVDGLQAPLRSKKASSHKASPRAKMQRVSLLANLDKKVTQWIWQENDELSRGGMALKLESARRALNSGIPVVIADGRKRRILSQIILEGRDTGTLIGEFE
jgi:glutamate 5-kinase